jgi:type II secretory pathway pseudopilin PulG
LIVVVVIIGVLAAIAVPRMGDQVQRSKQKAVKADTMTLSKAIELYAAEHGGKLPNDDDIAAQLTQYTSPSGDVQAVMDAAHHLGPYIKQVPPVAIGPNEGATGIHGQDGPGIGWLYDENTGEIMPNLGQSSGGATAEDDRLLDELKRLLGGL